MKARLATALLCLAALASLALPGAAAAKGGHYVQPASLIFQASLPKSQGFALRLFATNGEVQLSAHRRATTLSYSTRGHVSGNRIKASFGRFGTVDLTFKGGRPKPVGGNGRCKGKAPVRRSGVLVGEIRFHGKRGSIAASTGRVKATSTRSFRRVCKEGSGYAEGAGVTFLPRRALEVTAEGEGEAEEATADVLQARARSGHRLVEFDAIRLSGPLPALNLVIASVVERLGPVTVVELATPNPKAAAVSFSPEGSDPETATATPPSPFAGKGTYRHAKGSPATWTGSLRVRLPGSGLVHLTGKAFSARVCHGTLDEAFSGCGSG